MNILNNYSGTFFYLQFISYKFDYYYTYAEKPI